MTYREKVQNEIKKEELGNLWEKICHAYEQGGLEQLKSTLDNLANKIKKNYQEVIKNIEKKCL